MLRIAITGNIGSGKTTVCRIFESLGVKVYYADPEARKFYQREEVKHAVIELFGDDVFDMNDELITARLAEIAFGNKSKLEQLNGIIHPLVLDDLLKWTDAHKDEKYILYESALLFESGFIKHFDRSILVTAPLESAMHRVMQRDGLSEKEFMTRRSRQMPEADKKAMADFILENDEKELLIPKVITLHEQFMASES